VTEIHEPFLACHIEHLTGTRLLIRDSEVDVLRSVKRIAAQDRFGILDPPENVEGRLLYREEIPFDQVRPTSHVMTVPAQKIDYGMGASYEISPVPRLAENLLSEVLTVNPETKVQRTRQDFLHRLWDCQNFIAYC